MSCISEFETLKEKCFVLCMKIVILHFYQILINNVTFCLTYTYQVLVLIFLTCGVCWYHFVFDLRLLTHSCVFLWIVDETMLLTISVKWLMWHSAISRAKWIEGKQIYKWWGKLLVWKSKTIMFNLPWPSRKHRSVSIGRTVFTWGRNVRHPRSHVFADIHTIRLGIFWSTCILVISNSGLVLWFTRKHQFNSNYRSAWSLLKISPENSFSF